MPNKAMHPFNGDYYDHEGAVQNIMGKALVNTGRPNDVKHPFSGDFYAGDGSIHNIMELPEYIQDSFMKHGEWTPTVAQGDIAINSFSANKYIRIGNLVYVWARIATIPNTIPSTNVTSIRIGGLPYPANYGATTLPPSPVNANMTTIVNWGVLCAMPHNNQSYFGLSFVAGNTVNLLNASNHRGAEVVGDYFIIYPTDAPF